MKGPLVREMQKELGEAIEVYLADKIAVTPYGVIPYIGDNVPFFMAGAALAVLLAVKDTEKALTAEGHLDPTMI